MTWLRHLFAIAVLPFTVTVLVPLWIADRYHVVPSIGRDLRALMLLLAGVVLIASGLFFFTASLRRFAVDGRGTLAPWDPPHALVVRGLYRHVRNPMISGVVMILLGESVMLQSEVHAAWTAIFVAANLVAIPMVEEPRLRARFGEAYATYCRHVPRVVPRLKPWDPDLSSGMDARDV
jgi:protein-S-isoprenylcysteine O-methyltransferase Ste14